MSHNQKQCRFSQLANVCRTSLRISGLTPPQTHSRARSGWLNVDVEFASTTTVSCSSAGWPQLHTHLTAYLDPKRPGSIVIRSPNHSYRNTGSCSEEPTTLPGARAWLPSRNHLTALLGYGVMVGVLVLAAAASSPSALLNMIPDHRFRGRPSVPTKQTKKASEHDTKAMANTSEPTEIVGRGTCPHMQKPVARMVPSRVCLYDWLFCDLPHDDPAHHQATTTRGLSDNKNEKNGKTK